jgi:hypothetical protein
MTAGAKTMASDTIQAVENEFMGILRRQSRSFQFHFLRRQCFASW